MEADSSFAVSGGESSELLEAIEAAFDAIAEFIERPIMLALLFSADSGRDDRNSAEALDGLHDLVGVVAAVGQDELSVAACQQRQCFGILCRLTGSEAEGHRLSQTVGQQMDLGAQSTSGTPQSLVFAPFLRPVAAC